MRTFVARAALVALVAVAAACDVHAPVVIPAGAQVVRVRAAPAVVEVVPASVRAGDVYLVMEGPEPAISFVSHSAGPGEPASGMGEDQIERVALGDYQSTRIEGFAVTCAPERWTEGTHWEGCGENVRLTLSEGLYVVIVGAETPGVAPVMDVLEVTP
jgi:hypothetical protein